jgi:hypothetical protein
MNPFSNQKYKPEPFFAHEDPFFNTEIHQGVNELMYKNRRAVDLLLSNAKKDLDFEKSKV